MTTIAAEPIEALDLSDLDLLDDPRQHFACECRFPVIPPPVGFLYDTYCGKRALAKGLVIWSVAPDTCTECVVAQRLAPCPGCGY